MGRTLSSESPGGSHGQTKHDALQSTHCTRIGEATAAKADRPSKAAPRTWARMKGRRLGVSLGPAYSQAGVGSCHSRG